MFFINNYTTMFITKLLDQPPKKGKVLWLAKSQFPEQEPNELTKVSSHRYCATTKTVAKYLKSNRVFKDFAIVSVVSRWLYVKYFPSFFPKLFLVVIICLFASLLVQNE